MNPHRLTPFNPTCPSTDASAVPAGAADVVLIVDDVPDNLALLHDALDEAGYTVLVATDGPARCSCARQARPTSCCWTR
jgi:PleD family two-component response regulator